ncbi:MGMT family protein [Specibacter cremeus]|uniref:MGMT family protein n=1 Tax=Specibacter cremeus TaxID=1629051 RepID=UPI000F7B2A7A|nr:MGMT family protein [Specibacter cremeus]
MRAAYIDAVLEVAEAIPAARVLSYGDIAVLLDSGGPRQVGSVMSHHGSAVAWWRVIRASGEPPQCHEAHALEHYRTERTPLRGKTTGADARWRVDMAAARWDPTDAELDVLDAIAARLRAAEGAEAKNDDDGPGRAVERA